ncbi:cytochrome b561 [Cellvibrio zantedeschiae]|uniref:Cytochrome b561 n=1 Tax=Cellvibrio zantedeschiae TaxID=1237077 RepID=A0ABQ3AXH7_9GAMM|nr:cytochrome b/b6 domain-containing protein [Cellvibrio zantedeschiae]GGY69753.1 cytochrome b561 [Cellvibrio zantedeschiae]
MNDNKIILWDPLVRLFHWSIAGVFVANYWINETGEDWHEWLGYFAVCWLLVRFVWGFLAKGAARWSDFFPTYSRLKLHLHALIKREDYHRLGHSPLGALVMILMMLLILVLGISGFMMEEIDYFWGEDWVQDLHGWCAHALLCLVFIHLGAALFESYRLKENLPLSMITGKRKSITTKSPKPNS